MKKILLLLVALFMATMAFAYDIQIDGIYYNLDFNNKTAEVTNDGNYSDNTGAGYGQNSYIIPEKITYHTIEYSVTSIGERAFYNCYSLTSITIGNRITSIGKNAFCNCLSLTSITIPNSVTSIEKNAFNGCSSLTSITIPNSVTSIGDAAFSYCTSLTSISIPNSVTSIVNDAFLYCSSLTSIIIPNTVTFIGGWAFTGCTSLTSITIPNSVTSIGERAFYDCDALKSITIGNSVTSIGEGAFYNCDALSSITIPNSINSIGRNTFYNCQSLSAITIGNNLNSINENTFTNCSNLRTIKLGNSIESIGKDAFKGCTALYSFEISTEIPPIIDATTFSGVSSTLQIKVPCNSVEDYKTSSHWNSFSNFKGNLYSLVVNTNDKTMGNAIIVKQHSCQDISAQVVAKALPGYEFVKWSDGLTENPRTIYITSDTIITAEFKISEYNVTLSAENGTVNGTGIYNYGDTITISATPNEGYHFSQWSDKNTENPRTIIVTKDITLSAKFAINTYNIILSAENGSIVGEGEYNHGEKATIAVIPNKGYHFTQWSDGNTENPRTIVVTQDSTFIAEFAINTYNITLSAKNGTVIGEGEYNHGEEATIAVIPNEGYTFDKWSDGNTDNPRKIIVTKDINLIAILKSNGPSTNLDSNFNTEIRIYTTNNTLHIEGATTENYHILDATGRLIYSGNATTLQLPRGIYLITINGEVEKIVL